MKITKEQLKSIVLEEAANVKKIMTLKKQLKEVQKQIDEVMGGPHGDGKKTFKKPEGGDFSKENPGALVEDDMEEGIEGRPGNYPADSKLGAANTQEEESFDFSEEELEEMLNMGEEHEGLEEYGDEHEISTQQAIHGEQPNSEVPGEKLDGEEECATAPVVAEADKTSDPFTVDAPKQFNLKESEERLRMRKLAGLLK